MLYVLQPQQGAKVPDLPVAFATNTLYVLERNGAGAETREAYEHLLLPILRAKVDNLHAEGVAQAIWALANAELTQDAALWGKLKELVISKDFAPVFVKNERFSATIFTSTTNSDHFFQSELSEFADTLFFKDQMNLFEAYNGLVSANQQNPSLGLSSAIKHLDSTYSDVLRRND